QGMGHGLVTHGIRHDQHAFFWPDAATRFDGHTGAPLQFYSLHLCTSNCLVAWSRVAATPGGIAPSGDCRGSGGKPLTMSAAFSAIIMVEAQVFADGMLGMTEASASRNPITPWTRS